MSWKRTSMSGSWRSAISTSRFTSVKPKSRLVSTMPLLASVPPLAVEFAASFSLRGKTMSVMTCTRKRRRGRGQPGRSLLADCARAMSSDLRLSSPK